ncbi:insulinase family protein [Candidatus Roizmanbacteria bacterium]|nr:insulinase family protein [Candidatus Roizmanbacteria bacterium]
MKHTKKILSNGLNVITVPMPSFESATALLMVGAGSRFETRQNNGISHFFEHMAFKGTKSRPTFMEVAGVIDGIGGEFNAFTNKEYTGYYIKAAKNHIEICLDLLSDMIQNSLLDEAEIEKENGVIIEEINLYEDTPMRKIGDIYERLLYGDVPLGWDIAGEKDIIRKIKREDFIKYFRSYYSPSNMSVVVAGGTEPSKAIDLVEKYFINMKDFKFPKPVKVKEAQEKPQTLIRSKKTEQAHLALGVRSAPLHSPEKYPLSVLSSILGGGMSSRLFSEVREKRGLAYYVRAASDQYTDAGSLVVNAGVDPKRAEEAIEVIISELSDLRNGKKRIKKDELKKAKEIIKGHLVLELEDSRAASIYYAAQDILEKEVLDPAQILAKIDKVSEDDVMEIAKKYLRDKGLNLALIGDFKDKGKFEKLLKL